MLKCRIDDFIRQFPPKILHPAPSHALGPGPAPRTSRRLMHSPPAPAGARPPRAPDKSGTGPTPKVWDGRGVPPGWFGARGAEWRLARRGQAGPALSVHGARGNEGVAGRFRESGSGQNLRRENSFNGLLRVRREEAGPGGEGERGELFPSSWSELKGTRELLADRDPDSGGRFPTVRVASLACAAT
jgi:hypothetical protein